MKIDSCDLDLLLADVVGQRRGTDRPIDRLLVVPAGGALPAVRAHGAHSRSALCRARRISSSVDSPALVGPTLQQSRGLQRFVAERHQRAVGLALRRRGRARRAGTARAAAPAPASFCTRSRISTISRSAILRPTPGIRVSAADRPRARVRRSVDAAAREDRQRDARPDAGHLQQVAKQRALLGGRKAIQDVRILAHHQVREQRDRARRPPAGRRKSTSAPRLRSRRRRPPAADAAAT